MIQREKRKGKRKLQEASGFFFSFSSSLLHDLQPARGNFTSLSLLHTRILMFYFHLQSAYIRAATLLAGFFFRFAFFSFHCFPRNPEEHPENLGEKEEEEDLRP